MAGTYEIPTEGSPNSTEDPKIKTMLKGVNELLNTENKLGNTIRWQTPTVIATEETRENVAFGTLTTADEVKSVVLPANGLFAIGYTAIFKSSVSNAGRAAIFIGANQLKNAATGAPLVEEIATATTELSTLGTTSSGLSRSNGSAATAFVTTGQILGPGTGGGLTYVFAAAGTYNISVQFKATSGSVTAKERKLWVGVLGA
jgi:hypothetical protein